MNWVAGFLFLGDRLKPILRARLGGLVAGFLAAAGLPLIEL
jgi:hypothetical protein